MSRLLCWFAWVSRSSTALFEAIEFDNCKILNGRFAEYRVPRFSDMPAVEVVLVDRKDIPSAGAGETPIVGLAPGVANAIFNAINVKVRSLPLVPNGLTVKKLKQSLRQPGKPLP